MKILIIGGGIIGLLTAYELQESGATVTLLERGETGREASWAGGGILSPLYPWRCAPPITALASWSQNAYPALCARLLQETGIDPEYQPSGLLVLDGEERESAQTWCQRRSVPLERLDPSGLSRREPELAVQPEEALLLPTVAQVRNPRLARALRAFLESRIQVREREEVVDVQVEGGRIRGVKTRKGSLSADRVILCAGAWTAQLLERLGPPPAIQPVRGQMILFYAKPGRVRHIVLSRDRYVIPRRDGRILVGSTLEHRGFEKITTAEARESLYRAGVTLFPFLKYTPIETHWAGLRPGSPDGVPYLGAYPDITGLYFNAGHFRNGVVTAPASARLVADLVLGRDPILDPTPYALGASRSS